MSMELYPGIPFSPQAALTDNIGEADTIIPVSDVSAFPDAPNLATIGTDEDGETVSYAAKTQSVLSGCVRGVEGTAKAWMAGEVIARNFTAKDHNDLIRVVDAVESVAKNKQDVITGTPGQVVGFQEDGAATPLTLTPGPNITLNQEGSALEIGAVVPGKNLLHNWYFVGGGSQLGDGKFPINQKKQTIYVADGYTIDRWKTINLTQIKLTDAGLEISSQISNIYYLVQPIEPGVIHGGDTVTYSIFTSSGKLGYNTVTLPMTGIIDTPEAAVSYDGDLLKANLYGEADNIVFRIYGGTAISDTIKAAKLELGPVQTLAHKEGDAWVLNDPPPDYTLELDKCQRYFQRLYVIRPKVIGQEWIFADLKTKMRAIPEITNIICDPSTAEPDRYNASVDAVRFRGDASAYFEIIQFDADANL